MSIVFTRGRAYCLVSGKHPQGKEYMADISLFAKGITANVYNMEGFNDTHVLTITCDGSEVRFFMTEENIGYLFGTLNNYLDTLDKVAHA